MIRTFKCAGSARGQSLVEFSLVLPAAFLTVLLLLELFFIARVKLVMGFSADRVARAAAAHGHPSVVAADQILRHFSAGPAWGTLWPPRLSPEALPQGPGYPFLVIKPLNAPLRLSVVDLSFSVFPKKWFGGWIGVPALGAHVELPEEPEIPQP